MKDATDLGFPSVQRFAAIMGRSWDASVDPGIHQFLQAKAFDPESQDLARHRGQPLYQLFSEVDLPFAHVNEEDSGSEEDLDSAYTDCESEETRSSVVQLFNEIHAPFAHIVDGDSCHRQLSQQDPQDFKLHPKLQVSRIFIFLTLVQWIVARLILAIRSLVLEKAGIYAGFRSKQPAALDADTTSQSQDRDLAGFREDMKSFISLSHHQTTKYLLVIQHVVEDAEDWVANFVVATRRDMVSQLGSGVLGSFDDGFVVGIARSDSEFGTSKVYQWGQVMMQGARHIVIYSHRQLTYPRFYALIRSLVRFMASLDPVWSLVKSAQLRIELLKILSALGFSDDRWLRDVLQKDEADIARLFKLVVSTEVYKQAVLRLKGESAQHGVDLIQDLLDKDSFEVAEDAGLTLKARRLLVRLSEASDTLPSSLFIRGVSCLSKDPAFWGGFGDVYRASYRGQHVALKRIRPIFQKSSDWRKFRQRFCREALLWQRLQNPYVLSFIGIDAESFPTSLCMVSPWMQHGTILSHLAKNGNVSLERQLFEIAQGLAYLHSQSIIHGDLRGSNIMVDDQWHACLADFGLAVFSNATSPTYSLETRRISASCGLEKIQRTFSNDVYSFACVCIELYTGKPPFSDIHHEMAVALQVIAKERPARPSDANGREMMSDRLWAIVQQCWSHEVAERPCMDRVVELMMEVYEECRNRQ
ncbi:hypothetical protein MVEN_02148900 [Mycena venus]|uniref:Protein kinase domain-containing protein n=1 Tax=Mycena venus TaxID=2733690 RepID=A0A8H6X9H1_9AGAR|nr:hypothetical protein MVEN_02148900 [Mycena venus]